MSAALEIRLLKNQPQEGWVWNEYVMAHPHSTSDHLWEWREILSKAFGFKEQFYLAAFEASQVVGILPFYRIPIGLSKFAFTSIPFGNYGGICADRDEIAEALFCAAKEILEQKGGHFLELRQQKAWSVSSQDQVRHTHSRFYLPLSAGTEKIFSEIGGNNRSKIRRAQKRGLQAVVSDDLKAYYALHTHTARRHGTPCFPFEYFRQIKKQFSDRAQILFAQVGKEKIGAYFMIRFKKNLVCQFASSYADFHSHYPNEFLYWSAIEKGVAWGMEELDFCRSRVQSGSAQFKRNLRYREEPLGYQYVLPSGIPLPERSPASSQYQLAIRMWQRLPLAFANFLGPRLVRYFA